MTNVIKCFVFNSNEEWTTQFAYAIFSESKEEAEKKYSKILDRELSDIDYNVREFSVDSELVLHADGYDQAKMVVVNG